MEFQRKHTCMSNNIVTCYMYNVVNFKNRFILLTGKFIFICHFLLDNGVMMALKRRNLISLIFIIN